MQDEIVKAYEVIKEGGIIPYPTDTVWGIGCDATNVSCCQNLQTKTKSRNTKYDCINEWEKMMYNVFKEFLM
jgi:L-threonylcarbamoyladenylate synthase